MRTLRRFALPMVAALTALVIPTTATDSPKTIMVVVARDGWTLGSRLLHSRDRVSLLAELNATATAGDLLLYCDKAGWISYSCSGHPCKVPVCSSAAEGVTVRHFDPEHGEGSIVPVTAASLEKHEPKMKELAVLGVREGGRLSEAVLSKTASGVLWGPLLRRVSEGHYCFHVSPVSPEGAASILTFTLNWDRETDATGAGPQTSLTPGLYAVQKGKLADNGSCSQESDSASVWILLVPEQDYPRINNTWITDSKQIAELQASGAGLDVVSELRHAVLASLSDTVVKQ